MTPSAIDTREPIMLRAELSRDEYRRLRMLALLRGVPAKAIVGDAIRLELDRHDAAAANATGKRRQR